MAPDSNTASTAPSNSLAVAEGSQAPSHALLGSALAPAWAASTPETAFTEGSGPSADASDADDNQAALSPAAFLTHGPGSAGFPAASAGAIGRTDGTSRPASVEGAFADSSPVTGGNMATSGASGPVLAPKQALAPEQALAPRSQLSSSGVLPTGSGNNATASIEGLPGDGSGSTTSAPAVAPSAAVAPKLPTASELAGIGTDLGSKWWLWLLVAMATAATWLCCCCCMAAVLLLHRRSKRRIM